jgi:hypothetical protein
VRKSEFASDQLVNSARQLRSRGSLDLIAVRISDLERMLLLVEGRRVRFVQKVRCRESLEFGGVGADIESSGSSWGAGGWGGGVGSDVGGAVLVGGRGGGGLWIDVAGGSGVGFVGSGGVGVVVGIWGG